VKTGNGNLSFSIIEQWGTGTKEEKGLIKKEGKE
jgi:hypothetical protein